LPAFSFRAYMNSRKPQSTWPVSELRSKLGTPEYIVRERSTRQTVLGAKTETI